MRVRARMKRTVLFRRGIALTYPAFVSHRVDRPQLAAGVRRSRGGVYPGGALATGAAGALEGEPGGVVRLHGGASAGASHGSDGGNVPCVGGRDEAGVSDRSASWFCCTTIGGESSKLLARGFVSSLKGTFIVVVCLGSFPCICRRSRLLCSRTSGMGSTCMSTRSSLMTEKFVQCEAFMLASAVRGSKLDFAKVHTRVD